jgi:hypothetical protein
MNNKSKLLVVKLIHTIIWIFYVTVISFILYSGFANKVNVYTWIAIGLVVIEGLILLIFGMYCPITLMARKYSSSGKDNFDIFLPNWVARNNKLIFSVIFILGLILVVYRFIQ